MLLRIAVFLMMGLGLAGFAAVAWLGTRQPAAPGAETAVAAPATMNILVAARTLRPGLLLKPDDLTVTPVVRSAVPDGARPDTPAARAELLGAMLRRTIAAGEVVLPSQVMRAGERGFLAAVLGPGLRAATVAVDAVTGTAGLIWPGDYVDLILTETIDDPTVPLGRHIAGETVLHNIRVIAIDQELMQGAVTNLSNGNALAAQVRTVTLEVSPDDAERVAVATRLGHLSLSVISADAPDPVVKTAGSSGIAPRTPVTWGSDVSAALQTGRKTESPTAMLRIYEGSGEGKEFHFQ